MLPVLEARGVRAGYGAGLVLHDITFTVQSGEAVGLMGRNGMGRTTLIRATLGLLPRLQQRIVNRGDQLSGGEQQMLPAGRAFMTSPRLLILDEATEGLAPHPRQDLARHRHHPRNRYRDDRRRQNRRRHPLRRRSQHGAGQRHRREKRLPRSPARRRRIDALLLGRLSCKLRRAASCRGGLSSLVGHEDEIDEMNISAECAEAARLAVGEEETGVAMIAK